jgi:hypothetical protein
MPVIDYTCSLPEERRNQIHLLQPNRVESLYLSIQTKHEFDSPILRAMHEQYGTSNGGFLLEGAAPAPTKKHSSLTFIKFI